MWHLDEIIRRNNPTPPDVVLDDFMAGEDARAEQNFVDVIEFIVPDLQAGGENVEADDPRNYDSAEMWRRETITQYVVIDPDGHVIDSFDTYAEARDVAADDEQIVPLTGEGFVKAYL